MYTSEAKVMDQTPLKFRSLLIKTVCFTSLFIEHVPKYHVSAASLYEHRISIFKPEPGCHCFEILDSHAYVQWVDMAFYTPWGNQELIITMMLIWSMIYKHV